jgi:hypothetical protein
VWPEIAKNDLCQKCSQRENLSETLNDLKNLLESFWAIRAFEPLDYNLPQVFINLNGTKSWMG